MREEAAERGLAVAKKPDSHDICFIPDGDTRKFLEKKLGQRPGKLVDAETGAVLGEHTGVHGFTVGQRRGLGLDRSALDGDPRYVVGVDAAANRVLIGTQDLLGVDVITADHARWCGPAPVGEVRLGAQVRAHGEEYPARVRVEQDLPDVVHVRLDERVRRQSVPGLRVDGDRDGHRSRDPLRGGQHLLDRIALVVLVAERFGDPGARGRDDREARRLDSLRRHRVPRVREDERPAGHVQ